MTNLLLYVNIGRVACKTHSSKVGRCDREEGIARNHLEKMNILTHCSNVRKHLLPNSIRILTSVPK